MRRGSAVDRRSPPPHCMCHTLTCSRSKVPPAPSRRGRSLLNRQGETPGAAHSVASIARHAILWERHSRRPYPVRGEATCASGVGLSDTWGGCIVVSCRINVWLSYFALCIRLNTAVPPAAVALSTRVIDFCLPAIPASTVEQICTTRASSACSGSYFCDLSEYTIACRLVLWSER